MALAEREIALQTQNRFYTEDEYVALEEAAADKSEYIEGEIRPMSGGTDYHGALALNIGAELRTALRGRGCLVMSSDVKIWAAGAMYYPNVSIACGPREYHGGSRTVVANPVLLVEVLSPITAGKDRGEKFLHYQQIETLQSYLLVSQDTPCVEQFSRGENGLWNYQAVIGLESAVTIPALSVTLALSEIYDQIDFAEKIGDD